VWKRCRKNAPKITSPLPVRNPDSTGLPLLARRGGLFRVMNNWYANLLLDHRWLAKRREQLAIDRHKCLSCGRRYPEVTLCVHHTGYVPGWLPWDYPSCLLQTLCLECHNRQHEGKKPIYAICHLCKTLKPEEEINGRDEKHEWICETCIRKDIEQEI
jgi:hypothetical protein